MIEIKNLTKNFGTQISLDNINLTFKKSESIIIMGQNGAGKTTLIRSILGEYIPTSGSVSIDELNPIKEREKALLHIGFVPQLPPPIKLTVEELIEYASISSGIEKERIFSHCKSMDLDIEGNLKKVFFKLSGGMKQKLLIAIAIAKEPKVLIFDEPTANLDPKGREAFYALLEKLEGERLMLFVSHRISEVSHIINRKIEMDLGKVVVDEKL